MTTTDRAAKDRSGYVWPAAIVGLLSLNVVIVGITVYFAQTDPSAAVEPNYYEKAVKWDQTAALREASRRLGWTVRLAADVPVAGTGELSVRLSDAAGAGVAGAQVEVVAFHNARAADRRIVRMEERAPGDYRGPIDVDRDGRWHFAVTGRRGSETFVSDFDQDVVIGATVPAVELPAEPPR